MLVKFIEARPNVTLVRRVKAEDPHNERFIGRTGVVLAHDHYNLLNKNFTVRYFKVNGSNEETDRCCDPDEFEQLNL
jgi:hypothetical protein